MVRPLFALVLCAGLTPACSNSEFASGSAAPSKKPAQEKPEKDTDAPTEKDPKTKTKTATDTSTTEHDTDTDQADAEEKRLKEEEDEIKKTPGVEVTKVGVNFEDVPVGGDGDYNDAVLCFQGKFKVDNSNVVSVANQTVTGTTFSASGCNHNVTAEVIHKDGTKEAPVSYDSRATTPVTLKFKVGSKLEVYMTPYKGCNEGVRRNMHSPADARVQPNVCNNTGG